MANGAATANQRSRRTTMFNLAFARTDCAPGGRPRWTPKTPTSEASARSRIGGDLEQQIEFDSEMVVGLDEAEECPRRRNPEIAHPKWQFAPQPEAIARHSLGPDGQLDIALDAGKRKLPDDRGSIRVLIHVVSDRTGDFQQVEADHRVAAGFEGVTHVALHRPSAGAAQSIDRDSQLEARLRKTSPGRVTHP